MQNILFPLIFILLLGAGVAMADEQSSGGAAEPVAGSTQAAESASAASTPEETIAPLGAWIRSQPVASPTAEAGGGQAGFDVPEFEAHEDAQDKRIFHELLQRYKREDVVIPKEVPPPQRLAVTKVQRRRLDRLEKVQRAHVRRQYQSYHGGPPADPRGQPEMRVCSLNLDNYSLRDEVRRVLKDKQALKQFRRKERELVKAITEEHCTVVAVQAVIGTSLKRAHEGLAALADKLSEAGEFKWQAYLGASNHRLVFNGFLVSDFNGQKVETTVSHAGHPVLHAGQFQETEFYRGPFEIVLSVPSRDGRARRKVVLLTMHFRRALEADTGEPEEPRMQMAETLRRLIAERLRSFDETPPPILVVAGDRGAPRFAPSTRVLEGTVPLKHFIGSAPPCTLLAEEVEVQEKPKKTDESAAEGEEATQKRRKPKKVTVYRSECSPAPAVPKQLFGLVSESVEPISGFVTREEEGEKKYYLSKSETRRRKRRFRHSRERTAELYLAQPQLDVARETIEHPLRYAVSIRELEYLRPESPLLRVDLNW
ncbi:MAG: hypothetical protein KDD69_11045 [Bdellovibrionales bacterium]|nr:hypothetical protein [Bdellovibrionales bacterium]